MSYQLTLESMRTGDGRDSALMGDLCADLTSGHVRQFTLATRGLRFSERMDLIDGRTPAEHMTGRVLTAQCPACRTVHSGPHCPTLKE